MKFETEEWAETFQGSLNNNPNYKESAKTWEGSLILKFISENARLDHDVRLWLDLHHGVCREARFLEPSEEQEHAYEISAPETYWYDLVTGKVDASRAMMSGKLKIKGDMTKLMRYPKAAAYIIKYLKRHLENW